MRWPRYTTTPSGCSDTMSGICFGKYWLKGMSSLPSKFATSGCWARKHPTLCYWTRSSTTTIITFFVITTSTIQTLASIRLSWTWSVLSRTTRRSMCRSTSIHSGMFWTLSWKGIQRLGTARGWTSSQAICSSTSTKRKASGSSFRSLRTCCPSTTTQTCWES